jgi:transcription antitermination factor NusG
MEVALPQENWYAIQVRPRFEFLIGTILQNKGYEQFVPRYKSRRQWSDRNVQVELPLLPGYVFCRFNPEFRLPIIKTKGVVRVVGIGKRPLPIDAREIKALFQVVQSRYKVEPHMFVTVGARIRIENGALAGLEGIVKGYKNRHLIFSVGIVQKSILIELGADESTAVLSLQESA